MFVRLTVTATLDPGIPNLPPIQSNPAETEIGPVLGIVKSNDPTGQVVNGNQITYTLAVVNETKVTAQDVVVTDPVPVGTSYGTCTTPVGTCGESGGPKELALTIGAGLIIGGAGLPRAATVSLALCYTVIGCLTVIVPIAAFVVDRERMVEPLGRARSWLVQNNDTIMSIVFVVLGSMLIGAGVGQL